MKNERFKTQQIDGETLYLVSLDDTWRLTIEPRNRNNGTERYDGWFPRFYTNPKSAKASVTRKFGREWKWEKF